MSDVKWIKIVTDIFDDEKILLIETLPEADSIIVRYFAGNSTPFAWH